MAVLVSTVGATDANSYGTRAEADDYLASRVGASSWAALADVDKDNALITATYQLDDRFDFIAVKTTLTQALEWPRDSEDLRDIYGIADDEIPLSIKRAQFELAFQTISNDNAEGGASLDSVKIGSIEVDFDESNPVSLVPEYIQAIVSPLGSLDAASSGGKGIQQTALVR